MADESQVRKRFQSRSAAFDEQRRRQIEAAGGRSVRALEHQMVLEDHLALSIRRTSHPYAMYKLQLTLLLDLIDAEHGVAGYKKKLEELAEDEPEKDGKKGIWEAEREKYIGIRRALRDIGDGIAWRLFRYDRSALTTLASRPRKPHINIEGLEAELGEFAEVFNEYGTVAVLNDLTHYLKKADMTVRIDDDTFEFVEVKASRTKSGTMKRQRDDLRETIKFLNEGVRGEGDSQVMIQCLNVVPESHVKSVASIIKGAERKGIAYGRVGEHLIVDFTDWRSAIENGVTTPEELMRVEELVDAWRARGDTVLEIWGLDRYHEVRHYAPFSVYPLPTRVRVKLMTGALMTRSHLNVSAVLRYCQSRAWSVVRGPKAHAEDAADPNAKEQFFATLQKGPLTVALPFVWLGRIASEYLSPKTVVAMLEAMLANGSKNGGSATLVNLAGEARLWE